MSNNLQRYKIDMESPSDSEEGLFEPESETVFIVDNLSDVDSYADVEQIAMSADPIALDTPVEDVAPVNTINATIEIEDEYLFSYYKYRDDFMDDQIKTEDILEEENERFTILPIDPRFVKIWNNYKKQQTCMWVAEEIDLKDDLMDWERMSADEKYFIESVLAFFAASDGIVNMNLTKRFSNDIKIKEAQCAYDFQKQMENVHGEMYSLLLEAFIKDPVYKNKLINSLQTIPCIKRKGDWTMRWIESDKTFAHRLVAFAVVEGVFFSGSFASIFWLKNRSIMPGLIQSNKFISRDEGLHTDFACLLYSYLRNRLKTSVINQIVMEAVDIEKEFITQSLPCRLLGMNSLIMSQYIEYVADRLLVQLGYAKIYNVPNSLDYMETINMDNKDNFFEKRPTEYANSKINNDHKFVIMKDGF
jgi:ribonucleotide reductase beta subunit family protein with ferritin-like domain